MNTIERKPVWMAVSAPSGAGKTTLCEKLRAEFPGIHYSVSCTTRAPRSTEQDGVNYHFLSEDVFKQRIGEEAFLEYAHVHGSWYGTLKQTVIERLAQGQDVVMDIDVQGTAQLRAYMALPACHLLLRTTYLDVFIVPPSIEALRQRLDGRGLDAPEVIRRRVAKAQDEMQHWRSYQYVVVNDEIEAAYHHLRAVYEAAHWRTSAM
jgi:guanylate kinase